MCLCTPFRARNSGVTGAVAWRGLGDSGPAKSRGLMSPFIGNHEYYVWGDPAERRLGWKRIGEEELIMRQMISSLIALSVLAGAASSVAAQTKQDEDRADFWKYQERNLP